MPQSVQSPPSSSPSVRRTGNIALQVGLVVIVGGIAYAAIHNAAQNLANAHITSGFGFWNNTAGFDISQTLIDYSSSTSTFGRAFWVGLLNTLLVAAIGIVFATALGFTIGIARLSRNWLVAHLAGGYVELIRNVPLLLQLLFWYNSVLKALPLVRGSVPLPGGSLLNNRGLFLPRPEFAAGFGYVVVALLLGLVASLVLRVWARRRQDRTGAPTADILAGTWPRRRHAGPGILQCPARRCLSVFQRWAALTSWAASKYFRNSQRCCWRCRSIPQPSSPKRCAPVSWRCRRARPRRHRRSACDRRTTLRFVVVPQAMRVIVPPLTSQYLNLIKNSSLAVAIGYPDLVQVFAGSVLNLTGQAVEVIAITMAVYLFISLVTSLLMNLYGYAIAVEER